MGIGSKFKKTISEKFPDSFRVTRWGEYSNKSVAIDIIGVIYRFLTSGADNWEYGVERYMVQLIENCIDPIIVFEGIHPPEKRCEQEERRRRRALLEEKIVSLREHLNEYIESRKMNNAVRETINKLEKTKPKKIPKSVFSFAIEGTYIEELIEDEGDNEESEDILRYNIEKVNSHLQSIEKQCKVLKDEDMQNVREICKKLGLIQIDAPGEAEHACAWLCINGHVDAVISEDSDLIPILCPIILCKGKASGGTVTEFALDRFLNCSGLSKSQLIDWAIMCGTDYNKNIDRVGSIKSLDMIKKYGTIEAIQESGVDTSCLTHNVARRLFDVSNLSKCPIMIDAVKQIGNVTEKARRIDELCRIWGNRRRF